MPQKSRYTSSNYFGGLGIGLSLLALAIGGLIYLYLRPSVHVYSDWIRGIGLDDWYNSLRVSALSQSLQTPDWFVFALPNGLWAFAYSLLITRIWSGSRSFLKYFWFASMPGLVFGFELLQYSGVIHGTFSLQDLAFGAAGIVFGRFVGIQLNKLKYYEKSSE